MTMTGQNHEVLREIPVAVPISIINPTWTDPKVESWPVTDCLSHGTAFVVVVVAVVVIVATTTAAALIKYSYTKIFYLK